MAFAYDLPIAHRGQKFIPTVGGHFTAFQTLPSSVWFGMELCLWLNINGFAKIDISFPAEEFGFECYSAVLLRMATG